MTRRHLPAALLALALTAPALAAPGAPTPAPGDDLFVVYVDGAEGYADRDGKIVIEPRFTLAGTFSEGLARAADPETRKHGFIDPTGEWVIPPTLRFARAFSDGRAAAKDPETRRWGYLDAKGKWAIAPQYRRANPFSEGRAFVELPGKRAAVIDPSGKTIYAVPADADIGDPPRYREGLIPIELPETVRFVDRDGKTAFEGPWRFSRGFFEGLAPVRHAGGWSYVDRTGAVVLDGYRFAWGFSEGLAAVQLDGADKYAYIDRTGKVVIPPRFDGAYAFSEGRAAVEIDGALGYIDRTGKLVVEPRYVSPQSSAVRFRRGRAMVGVKDDKGRLLRGYIDPDGKVVRAPSR